MRASVYVGTSVDGFIARTDHTVDFLDAGAPVDPGDDTGFGALPGDVALRHVDTVVHPNGCVTTHWRVDRAARGRAAGV